MAIKKDGAIHSLLTERLRAIGIDPKGLEVATLGRGSDHLVLLNGETIGEYNHKAKRLSLYPNKSEKRE